MIEKKTTALSTIKQSKRLADFLEVLLLGMLDVEQKKV